MNLTTFRSLKIFFSIMLLFSIIICISYSPIELNSQNSTLTSDFLIDFSTFEANITGYEDDEPNNTYNWVDNIKYGDPCRIMRVRELSDYTFDLKTSKEKEQCENRLKQKTKYNERQNNLQYTAIWKDMQFLNWYGVFVGKEEKLNIVKQPTIDGQTFLKGTTFNIGKDYPLLRLNEDTKLLRIQIHFPISKTPYKVFIMPKFPIYEYDLDGKPINRSRQLDENGNVNNGNNAGVIDNVLQIKDIELDVIGINSHNRIYVVLSDQEGNLKRYFVGWTYPQFTDKMPNESVTYEVVDSTRYYYQPLKWSNSKYVVEPVNYIINPLPTIAEELKYIKFYALIIESDDSNIGENATFFVKSIKIIYDKQFLDRKLKADIENTDLWSRLVEIGKTKRGLYEKASQQVIKKDLDDCYYSPNREKDCRYSLDW